MFNSNFLMGIVLANDLPREQQMLVGLAAGQFPEGNMMGPVLLKPVIDERVEFEARSAAAEAALVTETVARRQAEALLSQAMAELALAQLPLTIEGPLPRPGVKVTLTLALPSRGNVSWRLTPSDSSVVKLAGNTLEIVGPAPSSEGGAPPPSTVTAVLEAEVSDGPVKVNRTINLTLKPQS